MSDISETIDRLQQWAEHWEDHHPPEFIADLRALIGTAKAAQRAAELLQKLDRYNVEPCSRMEWCRQGDWVDFGSVSAAIQILQELKP